MDLAALAQSAAMPKSRPFSIKDLRGFGLLQRDRNFDHYQDLDLAYELRPSYFVEPRGSWGEGRVELVELPTQDEAHDNIVASFVAEGCRRSPAARLRLSDHGEPDLRASSRPMAASSTRSRRRRGRSARPSRLPPGSRRFIIDFTGGDLAYYAQDPQLVEVVPTTTQGRILRSFVVPNSHMKGFRAIIDLELASGQSTDLRAFLRSGTRALTETWTYPWQAD